ncbi:MAG: tyramine oxidase [Actinobacteria bacterium]|nr:MAG: tyramine oxidase [Actinomycetota bacterium]
MSSHYLDPLNEEEIRIANRVIRESKLVGSKYGIAAMFLFESDKGLYRNSGQDSLPRIARAMVINRETGETFDVHVNLREESIQSCEKPLVGQAPMLIDEFESLGDLVKSNQKWIDAMRERGITDTSHLQIDPWAVGNMGFVKYEGRRLAGAICWARLFPDDNGYARPVEGVLAILDLVTQEVLDVFDFGARPIPIKSGNYTPDVVESFRTDIKPIEITQPEGSSITVQGHLLAWQKWKMRISLHPLEGLVLHEISYRDKETDRSILHRASMAEMIVPYGDADPAHNWRGAFDIGEFGLGKLTNSLVLGCDCLGEIIYMDAVLADEKGEPYKIPNAICIHEEDDGILWKHQDWVTGKTEVRRSRRLVVSAIHTVGNYEYGIFWYFHQDGSIATEVKLTGILQTRSTEIGALTPSSTRLSTEIVAGYHQHIFGFRLDFEVDGDTNSVYENQTEQIPVGPLNPTGNAFTLRKHLLERESDGIGLTDPQVARSWSIVNPNKLNKAGTPVGYKLLPGWASATILAQDPAPIRSRGRFAEKNVWVTPYSPTETRSAGDFPNQSTLSEGLPKWTKANREVANRDIVLWYNFGVTHIPRLEDWPVMPVERAGFMLMPVGFFDENPALDVPPSAPKHCH